jgi:hypothetical protein
MSVVDSEFRCWIVWSLMRLGESACGRSIPVSLDPVVDWTLH